MNISRKDFVSTIAKIKEHSDNISSAYELKIDLIDFSGISDVVVQILDKITNECEWVAYFIYELDFGSKYREGSVTKYGIPVDISTVDKLYDMLESDWESEKK